MTDAALEEPLEEPADQHGVGDVGDLHLVEAEKRRAVGDGVGDRADRVADAAGPGGGDAAVDLLHEGVEVDAALRADGRGLEEEVHQHRLAAADAAVEVEAGDRLLLEPVAAPAEEADADALRLRRLIVGETHPQELELLDREALRGVGVEGGHPRRAGGRGPSARRPSALSPAKWRLTRRFSRPFFSILPRRSAADLGGRGDMGAAAGLEVERRRPLADADEADPALRRPAASPSSS